MNNQTVGPNGRINYVAGLVFRDTKVMLIRKNRPEWMKGKLNGIRGHIESGETSLQAMCREFTEETRLISPDWKAFATLSGTYTNEPDRPWLIYWFTAITPKSLANPKNSDEPVDWYHLRELHEHPIMPNLLWLINMALERIYCTNMVRVYHVNEIY